MYGNNILNAIRLDAYLKINRQYPREKIGCHPFEIILVNR